MATYDQILNSYAVVILDLLPDETRINSENVADLLPKIKKAIHLFALYNPVTTTAKDIGGIISNYLNDPRNIKATQTDILRSYRNTILMLASYEVKTASEAEATSASFIPFIDQTIVRVSTDPANNYTITNLENFRTGGSKSIRTQILDKLVTEVHRMRTGRAGGRSRYNKRSNKRSVYRRRRSSKRQSRKVSKARSSRRK